LTFFLAGRVTIPLNSNFSNKVKAELTLSLPLGVVQLRCSHRVKANSLSGQFNQEINARIMCNLTIGMGKGMVGCIGMGKGTRFCAPTMTIPVVLLVGAQNFVPVQFWLK
ncbi:MAG: hypothetical protein J7K30_09110, partial [Deltaproteobacteria bacterium]|nr:hypothetical protein [Deltaproteobacteria bacterium]